MSIKKDRPSGHSFAGMLVLVLMMTLFIIWCFGPMVLQPNQYFFEAGGDGIRNYYSVAYYASYDSSLHFTGMNYPYGEHVLYTDNQFPLAYVMSLIQQHLFDVAPYSVAIINYVMILSLFLSALFLLLLLQQLRVKDWFAVPAAMAITLLSPQIQRMTGHYSLAYVFFTPLLLYLVFRLLQSSAKIKWTMYLVLVIIFFGLTHLYYLAMAGALIISFVVVWLVYERLIQKATSKNAWFLLASILVPLLAIEGFLYLTDPVSDRIRIPYGFFESYATNESVFKAPAWSYLKSFGMHNLVSTTNQGYAYIGLVSDLAIMIAACMLLFHLIRMPVFKGMLTSLPPFVLLASAASVPVLLFSMCLPWRWQPDWLEHFSAIRQFRALDRFAYVFYYVISVFAACLFFAVIQSLFQRRNIAAAIAVYAFIFALWFADGWSNMSVIKNAYPNSNYAREYFAKDNFTAWLAEKGYTPDHFQAILPLPFYHIGSEKIWIDHPVSMYVSSWASLNTGLPLLSSYLGRTSISQTMKLTQLMADTLIDKEGLQELNSKKPFLVITSGESLTPFEDWLLKKADFINERGPYRMFILPLGAFYVSLDSMKATGKQLDRLMIRQEGAVNQKRNDSLVIIRHAAEKNEFLFPALQSDAGSLTVFDEQLPVIRDSALYEVSVWTELFFNNYASPDMHLYVMNEAGDVLNHQFAQAKNSANLANGWVRIHLPLTLHESCSRLKVVLTCEDESMVACRFMIRPWHAGVFYPLRERDGFAFNNFPLGK